MVLRQPHRGGEKCFDGLALTDPGTGDHIPTQLFVGALRKIERLRPECKHFGFKSREGLSAFPRAKFVPAQPALQPGVNKLVGTSLSARILTSTYARHMLTTTWYENTR